MVGGLTLNDLDAFSSGTSQNDKAPKADIKTLEVASLPPKVKKGQGSFRPKSALNFDFEAFFKDNDIIYNIKHVDYGVMYRLDKCLYDSSHGNNDAGFILNTDTGQAVYKCFHESCGKRPWDEAASKISGKPLSEYNIDSEAPQFSFDDLSRQIEETSDFKVLVKDILHYIAGSDITVSERDCLLRAISKKTKVQVSSLREDYAKIVESKDNATPYEIALAVIQEFAADNILMDDSFIWLWDGCGVWKIINDRMIKKVIHSNTISQKLTKGLVDSVLDLVKTEIYRGNHNFDSDHQTINCKNGELCWDGDQWVLQEHCREHYKTTLIPIDYDPTATAPRFIQFLDEIFRDDEDKDDKKQVILEIIGYTLTTNTQFEKFLMLFGPGANGKSVLMSLVAAIVGPENVAAVQPSQFANKFQRAHLHNKLLNLVTEISEGHQLDDAELKGIASGELTTVEHKNKPPFDIRPFCTCWFGTNHMPHTRDFSDALFRRSVIITCNRVFAEHEQDRQLTEKLIAEKSGILNLSLQALARAYQRGYLTEPPSMIKAKAQWRLNADQAEQFVIECCDVGSDYSEISSDLYTAFTVWARACGLHRVLARNKFSQRLSRLGNGIELLPGSNGGPRRVNNIRLNHYFIDTYIDDFHKTKMLKSYLQADKMEMDNNELKKIRGHQSSRKSADSDSPAFSI